MYHWIQPCSEILDDCKTCGVLYNIAKSYALSKVVNQVMKMTYLKKNLVDNTKLLVNGLYCQNLSINFD